MKKTTKNLFTGAVIGVACGLYFGYEKNKEEKLIKWRMEHPGIAIKGEKVRALEDYRSIKDMVWKGKIYTVESYDGSQNMYSLLEYHPVIAYGGREKSTQWFPVELFEIVSPEDGMKATAKR